MAIVIDASRVQRFPVEVDIQVFVKALCNIENVAQLSVGQLKEIIQYAKDELESRDGN